MVALLGNVARVVQYMLAGRTSDVGVSMRCNLRLPAFGCNKGAECVDAGIEPATHAVVGELLRVHIDGPSDQAMQQTLFVFLRALFEPPLVGVAKVFLILDESNESIIFITRDAWLKRGQRHE